MILRSLDRHVRRLVLVAALSLIFFVALSLTASAGGRDVTVQTGSGLSLLMVELYWIAAAAMGASMATLAAVVRRIERGRGPGDPLRNWVGVLVGVMAGFILVALLPVGPVQAVLPAGPAGVALVGAFLASTIYRMVTGARTPTLADEGGSATAEP